MGGPKFGDMIVEGILNVQRWDDSPLNWDLQN